MRAHCASAALALILATDMVVPGTPGQSPNEADVYELERLETVWNDAHEQGNADALETLWADDIEVSVPRMPLLTRADVAKVAHSGRMKFQKYRTSDLHIRVYDNAAVVTGRLQRLRVMEGKEVAEDWRFTKVYIRQSQKWRVVAFHASDAASPSQ